MIKTYSFHSVENCNMCGSSSFKILGKRLNSAQGKDPYNKTGITTTIVKCKSCDLIYSNPLPIPASIQDHYNIPPEEYWKDSYFKVEPEYFLSEINKAKKLIGFKKEMKALDIGAGIGKGMIALSNAGFDTYGIETSESFYRTAIDKMNISPNRLKLSSMENASYGQEFDFISFGAVLEHLYDPSESIRKALSWLKPEGIIQIEVPSSDWLINRMVNSFYKIRGLDYVGNISPMHEPFHLYEFSLKSFQKNGELNQYSIKFHEYFICDSYMPKIIDKLLRKYMAKTKKGMQLSVWLTHNA